MLEPKADGWYSGGATWGDIALHTSFIQKFSTQPALDLTSPIYAQEETRYPFLFDFFTAQLLRHGFSIQQALVFSSLGLLTAVLVLFYRIAYSITKSVRGVWVASLVFFFNGGVGFWYFFQDYRANEQPLSTFIFQQPLNYAHVIDHGIHFSNIITDLLLPQRGIILGFAIFCVVLTLWQKAARKESLWFVSSVLIGLTPLVHVHTYLVLVGCLIWLLLMQKFSKKIHTKQLLFSLMPAVLLGGAQLWWMGIGEQGNHFLKFINGWMEPEGSLLVFWLKNLGIEFFFLLAGNIYVLWKVKPRTYLHHLIFPLLVLFFIGNIVSFQPHVYDNIKLFFYVHFVTAVFSAWILLRIARRSRLLAAGLLILLTFSGTLSVIRENSVSWRIGSNEDLAFAKQVVKQTESNAIFLTADSHNHPIPMLTGRSTILGYRGWLWTHGIDYRQTEAEVREIYIGGKQAMTLLDKHNISYVVIGEAERRQYSITEEFFEQNFNVLLQTNKWTVFAI